MLSTWVMVSLLCVTAVLDVGSLVGIGDDANAILTVLVGLAFIVLHGARAMGRRMIAAFIVITVAVSFTSEAIGVATGWVFGSYYYTDLIGPKLLGVPPLIQAGYAAVGYCSLMMARVIVGVRAGGHRSLWATTLAGAMIMVSWDVAMDPFQSTAGGQWIWRNGGEYFGVGLHNYAGWFGTVFLFMLLFQLYEARFPEKAAAVREREGAPFWSLPALYYALIALGIIDTPLLIGSHLGFATKNYAGTALTMEVSLALVAIFVMGSPVVFTLARLFAGTGVREALDAG